MIWQSRTRSLERWGQRLIDHDTFFLERKPAAVMKHGILRHYTTVFTTMLGSRAAEVWVIDAYAGPGEYAGDEDTAPAPGSPRIVCDVADAVKNCQVRGYFIEQDPVQAEQLRGLIESVNAGDRHIVRAGAAEEHLQTALANAGAAPVLLFLDPFGVALSFDALVAALTARPRGALTEILLNFNVESVRRIGGYLSNDKLKNDPVLTRVDNFVGGDWWRAVFLGARAEDERGRAAVAAEAVVEKFNAKMKDRLGLDAIAVPIRRRPETAPLFVLTLYFRNATAAYVFADAASSASRDWREFHKRQKDSTLPGDSLFSMEMLQGMSDELFNEQEATLATEWVTTIKENIRRLLTVSPEVRILDHVREVYGHALGQAREMHLRQAWDALTIEGVTQERDSGRIRGQVIRRAAV